MRDRSICCKYGISRSAEGSLGLRIGIIAIISIQRGISRAINPNGFDRALARSQVGPIPDDDGPRHREIQQRNIDLYRTSGSVDRNLHGELGGIKRGTHTYSENTSSYLEA